MGKKYRNLYPLIYDISNLWEAYRLTSKGKRETRGYLEFKEDECLNIETLHSELISGTYRPNAHNKFYVFEPKKREINALPFGDRIVQHSLNSVIEPIFDKTFLPNSYACRKNKGTHRAAIHTQASMRRLENTSKEPTYIQIDFSKYFHSIPTNLLLTEFDKKITCAATRELFMLYHKPDTVGLNIGFLSSQLSANIVGNIVDRFIKHMLRPFDFVRYMDDIVLFVDGKKKAINILNELREFIETMGLTFSRWKIDTTNRGVDFVGYRIWNTHKLMRKSSVIRAKRIIKKCSNEDYRQKFIASWRGHTQFSDSYNLQTYLNLV